MITSSSEFVAKAAVKQGSIKRLLPVSGRATHDCHCALCGKAILKDEVSQANTAYVSRVGSAFNDAQYMSDAGSPELCVYCVTTTSQPFIAKFGSSVITEEGLFPFSKAEDLAWWMLNTPMNKPFVMAMKKSAMLSMHTIWRTPINLSGDFFQIRHANNIYQVNRDRVFKAFNSINSETNYRGKMADFGPQKVANKDKVSFKYTHPFVSANNFDNANFYLGSENPKINENGKKLIKNFGDLSYGDTFMLCAMLLCYANEEKWQEILARKSPREFELDQ